MLAKYFVRHFYYPISRIWHTSRGTRYEIRPYVPKGRTDWLPTMFACEDILPVLLRNYWWATTDWLWKGQAHDPIDCGREKKWEIYTIDSTLWTYLIAVGQDTSSNATARSIVKWTACVQSPNHIPKWNRIADVIESADITRIALFIGKPGKHT